MKSETAYKLKIEGTTCVLFLLDDVFDVIKEYEFNNYDKESDPIKFELEICEMSEKEIEDMPEFEGF